MLHSVFLFIALCIFPFLYADEEKEKPIFAGHFIALSGENMGAGEMYAESYLYCTRFRGEYDQNGKLSPHFNVHRYGTELDLVRGLTDAIELDLFMYAYDIYSNGHNTAHFGDINLFLAFQMVKDPFVRMAVGGIIPTGKYKNLDPIFMEVDGVGCGSYCPFIALFASQSYDWKHPFNWTVNFYYILSSRVNVKGRNIYLDDPESNGVVYPGVQFLADLAFEYKFNKPWGVGIEFYFEQQNSSSYKNKSSTATVTDIPSSHRLSLFPTIEYVCSEYLSMIAGVWFSVLGRDSLAFTSIDFTLYYQF